MKKILVYTLTFCSIYACSGHKNSAGRRAEKNRMSDITISETLKTPEKRADLIKLTEVLSQNLGTKDNQFTFKLSKKEFKKTGLPKKYYHKIMREIKTNNEFIDANNLNADELLQTIDFNQKTVNDL